MVPIHIFYKELPIDENNIFAVNLGNKNEVEEVRLKNQENMVLLVSVLTKTSIQTSGCSNRYRQTRSKK